MALITQFELRRIALAYIQLIENVLPVRAQREGKNFKMQINQLNFAHTQRCNKHKMTNILFVKYPSIK